MIHNIFYHPTILQQVRLNCKLIYNIQNKEIYTISEFYTHHHIICSHVVMVTHSSHWQWTPVNSASGEHLAPEVINVHIAPLKVSLSSVEGEILPTVKHSVVVETEHIPWC